jgi:hypothetical protein
MEILMKVKDYNPFDGIQLNWEYGFLIECKQEDPNSKVVIIKANKAGLISLANHFLTLAQVNVPPGNHIHLDDSNGLENDSCELIIEKI